MKNVPESRHSGNSKLIVAVILEKNSPGKTSAFQGNPIYLMF